MKLNFNGQKHQCYGIIFLVIKKTFMKFLYLIFIACLFTSCNSQEKKEKDNKEIKKRSYCKYSLDQIKAIYFIAKEENLNLKLFTESFNAIDIDSSISKYIEASFFNENFKNISNDKRHKLIKKANEWLNVKNSIDLAIDNSDDVNYLDFFYNDDRTKNLFKFYLKNPNQDWSSLSSIEQYEIYYQIISKIFSFDSKEKLSIISDFYNKMNLD